MTCVGNDIIDLQHIDVSRTNNPAFYSKFLAAAEHLLYEQLNTPPPFEHFVWLLWSVKESVYKCIQRRQTDAVFSPINTLVTHINASWPFANCLTFPVHQKGFPPACVQSQVQCQGQTYQARSFICNNELICTIVVNDGADFGHIHWGIDKIEATDADSQSAAVRNLLLSSLISFFPSDKLSVVKHPSGYPYISINKKIANLPCSLSHHGAYVTYAFLLL